MNIRTTYFIIVCISIIAGTVLSVLFVDALNNIRRTNMIVTCMKTSGTDLEFCENFVNRVLK